MAKNNRIIRLDDLTIGLILNDGKLLVIENDYIVSMGQVPEEQYFIYPNELFRLPMETKIILNSVMISHGMETPFFNGRYVLWTPLAYHRPTPPLPGGFL